MFEQAAHIIGTLPIEILGTGRYVAVVALWVAIEQLQRNKDIEKVSRAALVNPNALGQRIDFERTIAQRGEYAELDRAQQHLGISKGVSDIENPLRRCAL